jgi:hypothetical protein
MLIHVTTTPGGTILIVLMLNASILYTRIRTYIWNFIPWNKLIEIIIIIKFMSRLSLKGIPHEGA